LRLGSREPDLPVEVLDQLGEPEHVFGPNVRLLILGTVCGAALIVVGIYLLLLAGSVAGGRLPLNNWLGGRVAGPSGIGLIVFGVFFIVGMRMWPTGWLFVCPRGLARSRGNAWSILLWTEIDRLEDATITSEFGISHRQSRLVLKDGGEWGFIADSIDRYVRLLHVLKSKLEEPGRKP
jgi:hypothetical protein